MAKRFVFVVAIVLGCLYATMGLGQLVLDPGRRVSLHCLVRNTLVAASIAMSVVTRSAVVLVAGLFLTLLVEIAIEYGFQCGMVLDPCENKIKNCYAWFDLISKSSVGHGQVQDLTEGMYACDPDKPYAKAQEDQRDWILDNGQVAPRVRILDVGSGNGNLLEMAKARGAAARGITLSREQRDYCRGRGLDVDVINFWDLDGNKDYLGKYDVVTLNGPLEHFVQQYEFGGEKERRYKKVFEILHGCLDPTSRIGRVVITCIHMHGERMNEPSRPFSFGDYCQTYFYERSYGGNLPGTKEGLTRNAARWFDVVKNEDHTLDYYIASRYYWYYFNRANMQPWVLLKCLLMYPIYLLDDPYFLHRIAHQVFASWTWQFTPPAPTTHRWLVLARKTS